MSLATIISSLIAGVPFIPDLVADIPSLIFKEVEKFLSKA
jgi:hypothetical protein